MARAMMDAATNPDLKVVMRFAGASASSTDQRSLLISVIDDLAALGALAKPTQWESDGDWFVDQVRNCLGSLTAPAVIFIDALDQLRAPYRPMWLPMQLNPNVKIIVSVLDDEAFASDRAIIEGLRGALSEDAFLEMDALDERDGRTILAGLQADAARGLTAGQQDFILERFKSAGASPLYLRLAFNIACRWRSSDHARARGLAADVVGLIGQYLDELSSVHHHEPLLVRRTLGLIAASREGLSEGEAIGALSRDGAVMEAVSSERFGVHTQRLPDSVWLRLRRSLAGLLVEKGAAGEPLMAFFHRQVTEVVRARFYDLDKTELHEALAAYFDSAPAIPGADPAWAGRAFPELPHQLFHAGKRLRLNTILCDPAWIEKKARSPNGVVELLYDYEEFAEGDDPACAAIAQAVRTIAPILVRAPEQVIQQLFGELQHKNAGADLLAKFFGRLPDLAIHATAQKRAGRSLETLRLSAPGAGPSALCAAGDGSVLSGHENGTIQVWRKENPVSTLTIRAHASAVVALTVSQDGRVVSAAHDGSVRVWDRGLQSKFELSPEGAPPTSSLRALSGARLACGSAEGVITLWDLEKRERLREMRGRSSPVVSMVELPGNRLASSSYNPSLNVYSFSQACNVSVWNLEDGSRAAFRDMPTSLGLELFGEERLIVGGLSEIKVLDARDLKEIDNFRSVPHFFLEAPEVFTHVAAIDAARVAVASSYGTIRIWNVDERAEVGRWAAHATSITGLCALHSQDVVSTSVGGGLQFSDPAALAGQTPADAHHVSPARCVALVNIDGATLARGSSNGDVDFWNVETGEKVRRTLEAGISVTGLAFLRGGQIATSIIGDYSAISWDGSSLDALQALKREERRPTCLTTMGDRILVIGFDDGVIRFWSPDVRSRSLAADIEYDNESSALSHLKSKRFRQDGEVTALLTIGSRLVVSGDVNGAVRVWDVDGDRQIAALTRHQGAVRALTAIDKNTFLSAGDDTSIRCWDLAGNPKGAGLSGHEGPVLAMLKLPDDLLLSGAADNTIRLWDRARHTEMSRLTLDAPVTAFAPLGASTFAAGDQLGLLHWLAIKTDGARSNQGAPPPKLNLLGAIAKALRGS
ncbi:MAG: WD40 repeat domain-containing protein [Hyphomonadaceae bacterium]